MPIDPVHLSQELIRCKSITPVNDGAIELLAGYLEKLGFSNHILEFGSGDKKVSNLYSVIKIGNGGRNLCFAGHTDVVPSGDITKWKFDPFAGIIDNDILYGRGAVDMKVAIACFISAISEYLAENKDKNNITLSLLITGDEEGDADYGTIKVLEWIKENNHKIDACVVGEPTNPSFIGEMIKIGRRGSINFVLTIKGTQGHVAYPKLADNPVPKLVNLLQIIKDYHFDSGNQFFDPTNLEITNIEVGNKAANVIPMQAKAEFNIRFNNEYSSDKLIKIIDNICKESGYNYDLSYRVSGESFLTNSDELQKILLSSIKEETGHDAIISTSGGTSDARFIKDLCPVIEFGLINKTAHKIDEQIAVSDIYALTNIYKKVIEKYFSNKIE